MKLSRTAGAFILTLALLLCCLGCTPSLDAFDNEELRTYTENMLDSILAGDADRGYTLVADACTRQDFDRAFGGMQELLGNADHYELSLLSIHQNNTLQNGTTIQITTAAYQMTTPASRYIIEVRMHSAYQKLAAFYIIPYENTDYHYTGTMDRMQDATASQWVVLLTNLLSLGLCIFALVDCCRQRVRKKFLMILLIVLGFLTVGLTLGASSVRLNFNIGWILSYSALIRYGSGTFVLRFMLPIGAIVWLVQRKKWIAEYARSATAEQTPCQEVSILPQSSQEPPAEIPPAGE